MPKTTRLALEPGDALALGYELRKSLVRLCTTERAPDEPSRRHENDGDHIERLRRLHGVVLMMMLKEDLALIITRTK